MLHLLGGARSTFLLLISILALSASSLQGAQAASEVSFSVQTNKSSYLLGETVHVELVATNLGPETVTYVFPSSCDGFFFQIFDSSGGIVFSTVPGPESFCTLIYATITLLPDETKSISTLDWNPQVNPGAYLITGVLHYHPSFTLTLASKSITIGLQVILVKNKVSWTHHLVFSKTDGVQVWTAKVQNNLPTSQYVKVIVQGLAVTGGSPFLAASGVVLVGPGATTEVPVSHTFGMSDLGLKFCFVAGVRHGEGASSMDDISTSTKSGCFALVS